MQQRELTDTEQKLLKIYDAMKIMERKEYLSPQSILEEIVEVFPNWRLDSILSCFEIMSPVLSHPHQIPRWRLRLNLPTRMGELFRVLLRHVESASY